RDREARVRLGRDGAEAHRAGREALHDLLRRLDLLEGHAGGRLETQETAESATHPLVLVDVLGELPVRPLVLLARSLLDERDRPRIPHVPLALRPPVDLTVVREHGEPRHVLTRRPGLLVSAEDLFGEHLEAYALD